MIASCLRFERQTVSRPWSRAYRNAGTLIASNRAMIPITTNSSMRVKAFFMRFLLCVYLGAW